MLRTLIRTRFELIFYTMNFSGKTGKARKAPIKALIAIGAVYIAACFFLISLMIFKPLCRPFVEEGYGWFYFAFAGIMSFVVGFIGSVFSTQSQIFEAKDNELLLSMPIMPAKILMSRMMFLLLTNYFYEAFIMIPAGGIYWYYYPAEVSVKTVFAFVICFLTLPLLVLSFSGLFGWGISMVTAKIKYKNAITTAASLVLIAGYFMIYFRIEKYMEYLINNGSEIAGAVQNAVFPAYYFGKAIATADFWDTVLFIIFSALPFIAVYLVISAFFFRIVTANHGINKIKYRRKAVKRRSLSAALLIKELSFFASRPLYIMNTALGAIFMLVISVMLAVKGSYIIDAVNIVLPGTKNRIPETVCMLLCLFAAFNTVSAPSLSLEGNKLWIPKSLPVSPGDVLISKAMLHFMVCAPFSLVSSFICILVINADVYRMILMVVVPASVVVFQSLFGVAVNLKFPKFDWVSETIVIKQSLSVLVAMFGGIALVGLPVLAYSSLLDGFLNAATFLLIYSLCFIIASVFLYRYIVTKGVKIFESL